MYLPTPGMPIQKNHSSAQVSFLSYVEKSVCVLHCVSETGTVVLIEGETWDQGTRTHCIQGFQGSLRKWLPLAPPVLRESRLWRHWTGPEVHLEFSTLFATRRIAGPIPVENFSRQMHKTSLFQRHFANVQIFDIISHGVQLLFVQVDITAWGLRGVWLMTNNIQY